MTTKLWIGLFAVVVAGVCLHHAFAAHSPKYTAQAIYSINWNQIGTGDAQYDPWEARESYNSQIASVKVTTAFAREVCQDCGVSHAKTGAIMSDLQHHLIVQRIGSMNGSDMYVVKCSNDDQQVALEAASLMARRLVAVVDVKSKIENIEQRYSERGGNVSGGEFHSRSREQTVRRQIV